VQNSKFEIDAVYMLAWTTTPWTLPGNVALAVGADLDYVLVRVSDWGWGEESNKVCGERARKLDSVEYYIVAKERFSAIFEDNKKYTCKIVSEFKGAELDGLKYEPLFDYFVDADMPNKENLYKVVTADFVSSEDGTGIVHIAPAFGEDDMLIGREKNLPFIQHVLPTGRFVDEVKEWAGVEVKPKEAPMSTDKLVVEFLQKRGKVFDSKEYAHSYPHCWRCDTPLLNYTTSSWFVSVTKIKERLLEQAKKIYWFPEHIKEGRFGKWLEGAKDWAISRSRYWGNPMPVWRCACGETIVVGSREELEKLSGVKIENLHKQFVDAVRIFCPKCGEKARRIPEVLDCWFESASMPYGQMHYPFENKEKFEKNFPAEFIAEGVDQTRAWFYVLHVLSVSLFDSPAYKNVIVNGTVLAEDGQKMSKRKKNYPDPMDVVNKYGSDALRYYLMTSPVVRAEDLCFSEKGVEDVFRRVILTLMNVLSFYQMYAGKNVVFDKDPASENVLDRWIIAKMNLLIAEVTEKLDAYNLADALKPIGEFVNELSTWFVRRSRDRFKKGEAADKARAVETLGWILRELSIVLAPFTPFVAEHVYKSLNIENALESVHLVDWPRFESLSATSNELLAEMDFARRVVELGLAVRDEKGIKVRQPLPSIKYSGKKLSDELEAIIAEELNVKEVVFEKNLAKEVAANPMNGKTLNDCVVKLNTEIDATLEREGLLRELVRQINFLRKQHGMTINDRVVVFYKTESARLKELFGDEALVEQLKVSVLASEVKEGAGDAELKVNGEKLLIGLIKG
jgi:isoleucyl-tRNA synthetase